MSKEIRCSQDGRIYLGKIEGKGDKEKFVGKKVDVTEDVILAVVNHMSIRLDNEDVPEIVYNCDSNHNDRAVLVFKYIRETSQGYQ